jgi:hypothetical protein
MSRHATSTDPGSRSAAEIEREVQQSRAEIEHTLDAIGERLSPGELVDQALGYFRSGRGVDFVRNLGDSVAQNPIPVALMGVGLAWMMFGGQRLGRAGGYREPAYWEEDLDPDEGDLDPVEAQYAGFAEEDIAYMGPEAGTGAGLAENLSGTGETTTEGTMSHLGDKARYAGDQARRAGEKARRAAREARERFGRAGTGMAHRAADVRARARYHGRRAKEGMLRSLEQQPLVLGAIGLAIGAAIGAALPATETEDELLGEARDKALRRATKVGREGAERVREVAGAVAGAAREEAEKHVSTSDTPYSADPEASLDRS